MTRDLNPEQCAIVAPTWRHCLLRLATLFGTCCIGLVIGSYISAELLYLHYPEETRTINIVCSNTIEAVLSSPISMSIGLFPSIGFYGSHGFLVILGAMLAIVGSMIYFVCGRKPILIVALAGYILWAHNNYLSICALMSV